MCLNASSSLNKWVIIFLLLICCMQSNAQWYNPEKVNKKAKTIYLKAYNLAVDGKYQESIQKIGEAIALYPKYIEAILTRAGIYADQKKYSLSVIDFEKAIALDSAFCKEYLLPYSISLAGSGKFEEALLAINSFLSIPDLDDQSIGAANYRKKTYCFALAYKKNHPATNYLFEPKNIGPAINSVYLEYYPSLTIDGKEMIFNRRINGDEDFYESRLVNGEWSTAMPIKGKLNTNLNEGAQTISQDGQSLIFTGCNYPEGYGNCDLYISFKNKNNEWTEAENLGASVNTDSWESNPSLSPDKKDLYFSSNRPGGYGGKDIWVSHKTNKGGWSKPTNLGPIINTKNDETCPFIHSDNLSLYFNSNGHEGYGRSDLFISKKNEQNGWSEPLNLGYPVNTIDDEGSLIVASDGISCYYASDFEKAENGIDIYSFKLRDDIKSLRTLWIKGHVFDQKTSKGLPCSIELTDINNRNHKSSIQTDEDGYYFITLPEGKSYAFNVERKGYLIYSENFALEKNSTDSFYNIDIALNPIEAGAKTILKNIFFSLNSFELMTSSNEELDKIVSFLFENPKVILEIEGHTDNTGTQSSNLLLSQKRSKSVFNYLVSKGIDSKRLRSKGMGDSYPIDTNDTEQGKSNNRRTEIHIISN